MAKPKDGKTQQDRFDDAVREAVRFAAGHGASEDDLERIVRRAGVPREYLRHAVADTGITMDGLLAWTFRRLMSVLDHAAGCGENPLQVLERVFESHVRFMVRNPGIGKLLRHILGNPHSRVREQVQKVMRAYEREIAVIVQQAKRKELVRDDVSAGAAATLFVGMVQAQLLRMQILGNAQIVRHEARAMLKLYLGGIRTVV